MAETLILTSTQQSRSDQNMKQTPNIKAIILGSLLVFQENPIYNINRFVLQENGILLGGCLTVKN